MNIKLSASEMTYLVSGGALNSTHSLTIKDKRLRTKHLGRKSHNGEP